MKKNKSQLKKQNQPIVTISNLSKKIRLNENQTITVFDNINFTIKQGESIAFLGPNGSGKTTLLNLISGIDTPDSGTILFENNDIVKLSDNEQTKLRMKSFGFLTGSVSLFSSLDIQGNVELPLLISGSGTIDSRDEVIKILGLFRLDHLAKKYPHELSIAEMRRVQMIQSFVNKPTILFIDEFATELNSSERNALFEELYEYVSENNITTVMATDDVSVASKSKRLIRIESGKLL